MDASWDTAYWMVMFFMWWVMMVAMMLPSAASTILLAAAINRKATPGAAPFGGITQFTLEQLRRAA
jgi:predicted metal-binding membrane protein